MQPKVQQPPLPQTKAELLEQIARGRAELEEWLGKFSDAQLTAPGKDGWTVKDHLLHLAVWEYGIAALLRREPRYRAMGIEEDARAGGDFDALNAKIYERHRHRLLREALEYFRQTHQDLLSAIKALSDADLQKAYSYYQPHEAREDKDEPIMRWIVGNSYGHYQEHIEWMRAWAGLK